MTYKKISHVEEILARLETIPPDENSMEKMIEMNKYMEEVHQEYLYKMGQSELSAEKVILHDNIPNRRCDHCGMKITPVELPSQLEHICPKCGTEVKWAIILK